MLTAIRQIALDFLATELNAKGDVEDWYERIRADKPDELLGWLVESPDNSERYYTLRPEPQDAEVAILEVHDLKESDYSRLPFNQGTGAQSAALGPIIKRTFGKKTAGPSKKIQTTTLKSFQEIAEQDHPWSNYFKQALNCFQRPVLRYGDEVIESNEGAFSSAIQAIDEKQTVLLAYQDENRKLPGEIRAYGQYLQRILAETKYTTSKATRLSDRECAICGDVGEIYPNAIKGARINFANVDRVGAFPGMEIKDAWKHFALCGGCADLLYIFSFHLSDDFKCRIAGENALVVPSLSLDFETRKRFHKRFSKWIKSVADGTIASREASLLRILADDAAINELTILWADFGQRIDNVRGMLSEILPSRLRELEQQNLRFQKLDHPAFPIHGLDGFDINLSLSFLLEMLKRPGGKKAKKENESKRLFDLRRSIAESIYHGRDMSNSRIEGRFWDELMKTARWHLMDVFDNRHWEQLLYEGYSEKKNVAFQTFAGWIRHLTKILHYFRTVGVLPMPAQAAIYKPEVDALKPFFSEETAIDSEAKAFAFILGVLYGKVMQVQAARGVNVGANALTWLKRLTLNGKDLPELYIKVREKLLAYETEKSSQVRDVVTELGNIGSRVGDLDELSETDTCYFLLLGQSLATSVLPTKKSNGDGDDHNE